MPATVSIVAVLEHYGAVIAVPETGWRPVKCPFHQDRTASASVNIELNGFRCHACGMSGDAIKLIEQQERLDFRGAIEFARQVLGESCEELPQAAKRRKPKRSPWSKSLFD